MTQNSKEYDLEKIKAKAQKQREELSLWLKRTNRSTKLLDTFTFPITLGEIDSMITHIETLQSKVTDDWK